MPDTQPNVSVGTEPRLIWLRKDDLPRQLIDLLNGDSERWPDSLSAVK